MPKQYWSPSFLSLVVVFLTTALGAGMSFKNYSPTLSPSPAFAAGIEDLTGYAWSSNIGWISFNCINTSACAGADYKVQYDPATGLLSGLAWSSNIGFVSFNLGDLAGCPSGACEARVNSGTGYLEGWARAVAGR